MPVAYSYVRFSSLEQQKGDSLRRQMTASAQYAAQHGLVLDDSLHVHDLGVSAFHGSNYEHGALGQFIAAIDSGKISPDSYLLVESLDRLSRLPVTEALAIFQQIINRGITIVTLTDSAIYSKERLKNDWLPLLTALVSMSRAHEESAIKSKRVKAAWDAKKERAKQQKEVLSKRCPWWLKASEDRTHYEIIEEKAEIVRKMFQMSKNGMGGWSIVRHLNEQGIPTIQRAKYWSSSSVNFTLKNIAAIGVLQLDQDHNGQTTTNTFVEDYYPPVIDKSIFYEVQALRKERDRDTGSISAGRKGRYLNIFQGIVKCGYCGTGMHVRNRSATRPGNLYCGKSLEGAGCIGTSYNIGDLETEFMQFTRELDTLRILGDETGKNAINAKRSELAACEGKLEDAEKRFNNLMVAVETGGDIKMLVMRIRSLEGQMNELKKQRLELQSELQSLTNTAQDEQHSYAALIELMEELKSMDAEPEERMQFRMRMQSEIQKVVRKLLLFSGGPCKPVFREEVERVTAELRDAGYEEDRINAYFDTQIKPDRTKHYFIAFMRNGIVRSVKDGEVLETDQNPDSDLDSGRLKAA
ncbi:recombinase family protein [Duganella sp. sic0402]|uniref:recombinase family protein n=1 Tax=Duganella sp. sic0402 TaxID=2854786 RepID=UPI001C48CFA8|nr:recombinase family protein [Duganella sp. sic0402]MBV7539064.1 recombinase family protein [Duganella sp. sic0402]